MGRGDFVREGKRWGGILTTIALVLAFGVLEAVFGIDRRLAAAAMLAVVFLAVVVSRRWRQGGDSGTAPGSDGEGDAPPPRRS